MKNKNKLNLGKVSDAIVLEFLEKKSGFLVVVSDDALVTRTLRSMTFKTLGVKSDHVANFSASNRALKEIKNKHDHGIPLILFVERELNGRPSSDFIYNVKKSYPEVKIIVLTTETDRDNLVFLHELGVNNIITKPVSMTNFIEKIAGTLKPQGKLGQLIQQGKEALARGDYASVLEISDKVLEIKPGSPAGLMLKGDALDSMGNRDEAIMALEEAHASSHLYLEPLKKLADIHKNFDDDRYLDFLKKLDKLSPLNTDRKIEIGKVYVRKDEVLEAKTYFDQAIENATREAMGFVGSIVENIADTLSAKSPEIAEQYLVNILELKGESLSREDLGLFNRLGISLKKQGKIQDAIANYTKALTIAPEDEGLYYNLSLAYYEGGETVKAAKNMDKALELNERLHKSSEPVCYNMAFIHFEAGNKKKAEFLFEALLELNPQHIEAKKYLAKIRRN